MAVPPVFPAYVGMSPLRRFQFGGDLRVPRIRGDEPMPTAIIADKLRCSPHTWG